MEGLRLINFNRRSEKFVALNSKVFNRRTSIVDSALGLSKLRIYSGIDKILTEFKSPSSACPCAGCRLLDGAWSEMTQPENPENLVTCTSMCTLVKQPLGPRCFGCQCTFQLYQVYLLPFYSWFMKTFTVPGACLWSNCWSAQYFYLLTRRTPHSKS